MIKHPKPLIALDFDGTIANTSVSLASHISVHTAYQRAFKDVYGTGSMYYDFNEVFGNRAPREMAEYIDAYSAVPDDNCFKQYPSVAEATARIVEAKLSYILPQISTEWPPLYDGVQEFFHSIAQDEIPVETAIISSGHDAFIQRVFEVHDIPMPDYLVTSDTLIGVKQTERKLYKPYTYQLAVAHKQWQG